MCNIEIKEVPESLDNGSGENKTKDLGCLSSYKGGRCESEDPIHCVYDSPADAGADKCTGTMKLLKFPKDTVCKELAEMYKCVKIVY
jgi:hypothetical protein